MGFASNPGGTIYFDPNNQFAVDYVNGNGNRASRMLGNAALTGKYAGAEERMGLSRNPNTLNSGNKGATSSVSGGNPNQPAATALDTFKIKDKEDSNSVRKKASNHDGNKSLTIPVGNGGGVNMVGKV